MKAGQIKLNEFLMKQAQFLIPIYQRTYSWTLKQCNQLWKDIIRAATDEKVPGHFVGSIVYIEKGLYSVSSIPQLMVIDGQQRLTTITLLLSALGRALPAENKEGEITERKINNYFIFNSEEQGELRYKLILTQSDKQTLIRLIEGKEPIDPVSPLIIENYKFFEEQISKADLDPMTIYRGIAKLIIVDISLERDHDNPQLIFESLNSTGLELREADKIRNYVLMSLEPKLQQDLYYGYWFPMEQSFGKTDYFRLFDRFMRDYLIVNTGRIPNIGQVYEAFKLYATAKNLGSIQAIAEDIYVYSKFFVNMALERDEDIGLRQIFKDINTLKIEVSYPLLLELYADYTHGRLLRDDFIEILKLVESYVFRRAICGIPTQSLNKTFATLSREIDKNSYLESFKAALLLKDSYRRFPDDKELMQEIVRKDLYNIRIRKYWLDKLENYDRKERVNTEEFTVEHIMPQNEDLSASWREELGENWKEIQNTYLHTLGNLTLTGYNPELSDRPFIEKRDMPGGFKDSPIRLNKALTRLKSWNENEIKNRAKKLSTPAVKVWPFPYLTDEELEKYRQVKKPKFVPSYTFEDHPHLIGAMWELFQLFRKRVLNLDPSVEEKILKHYIAYKITTTFVCITPQKSRLVLSFRMDFDEIDESKEVDWEAESIISWEDGYVGIALSSADQLDEVMAFVRQSFEKQMEYGDV